MTPLEWWGLVDRAARMTDKDRELVLALREYEAGLCSGCGHHKTQSMDEANDGTPTAQGKYVVGPPWVCFACEALGKARATFHKGLEDAKSHDHGQYQWGAQLVPTVSPHRHTT